MDSMFLSLILCAIPLGIGIIIWDSIDRKKSRERHQLAKKEREWSGEPLEITILPETWEAWDLARRSHVVSRLQEIFNRPVIVQIGEPQPGSIGFGPGGVYEVPAVNSNEPKLPELQFTKFTLDKGTDEKYRVGQVWRKGGTEDSDTQITILQIDAVIIEGEVRDLIFHVRVDGFKIMLEGLPGPTSIQHLPLSREALEESTLELIQEDSEIPEFQQGYEIWREAFLNNSGGFFDTPI